jgi:hypothetical protein
MDLSKLAQSTTQEPTNLRIRPQTALALVRRVLDLLVVDGLVAAAVVLARDVLGTLDEATVAGVAAGVADLLLGAVVVGHLVVLAGKGRGRLAVQWVVGGWLVSEIEYRELGWRELEKSGSVDG